MAILTNKNDEINGNFSELGETINDDVEIVNENDSTSNEQ